MTERAVPDLEERSDVVLAPRVYSDRKEEAAAMVAAPAVTNPVVSADRVLRVTKVRIIATTSVQ